LLKDRPSEQAQLAGKNGTKGTQPQRTSLYKQDVPAARERRYLWLSIGDRGNCGQGLWNRSEEEGAVDEYAFLKTNGGGNRKLSLEVVYVKLKRKGICGPIKEPWGFRTRVGPRVPIVGGTLSFERYLGETGGNEFDS